MQPLNNYPTVRAAGAQEKISNKSHTAENESFSPLAIFIHGTELYPVLIHCRTIPYLYTLNRTIPYLNTLTRTIPYLNTLPKYTLS